MMSKDDVVQIPVDKIRIINPRVRDPKKYHTIVESIQKLGLKRPITVTRRTMPGDEPYYDLVCGQGRLEAYISLGQSKIPALVKDLTPHESLLASLAENIARRKVKALDQIKAIKWMSDQGYNSNQIGAKTGFAPEYITDIMILFRNGEERLLDAVLNGRVPITIAARMAGSNDEEAQKAVIEAYEGKLLNQRTLTMFRRVVDQRRYLGREYTSTRDTSRKRRTSADSLVAAYKRETQRQKLMIKKAKTCEARLLSIIAAFRCLTRDDNYLNLLRAEDLGTMPKFLAERIEKDN